MQIIIGSVPKSALRNEQCGDWYYDEKIIRAAVDESLSEEAQLAVGIHEVIEAFRCRKDRVSDKSVCDFDERYEKERKEGKHSDDDEPGDDPRSPYRQQHMDATHVERAVCHAVGLDWKDHNKSITE